MAVRLSRVTGREQRSPPQSRLTSVTRIPAAGLACHGTVSPITADHGFYGRDAYGATRGPDRLTRVRYQDLFGDCVPL